MLEYAKDLKYAKCAVTPWCLHCIYMHCMQKHYAQICERCQYEMHVQNVQKYALFSSLMSSNGCLVSATSLVAKGKLWSALLKYREIKNIKVYFSLFFKWHRQIIWALVMQIILALAFRCAGITVKCAGRVQTDSEVLKPASLCTSTLPLLISPSILWAKGQAKSQSALYQGWRLVQSPHSAQATAPT